MITESKSVGEVKNGNDQENLESFCLNMAKRHSDMKNFFIETGYNLAVVCKMVDGTSFYLNGVTFGVAVELLVDAVKKGKVSPEEADRCIDIIQERYQAWLAKNGGLQ